MVDTFSSLLVYSIARLGLKSERTGDGAPSPIIGTKAPMPSHQIYSVLPLDLNSETIRVVEVLPGNDPDIISCKLHLRKLQETSPYTALSYSWGEKNTPTKEVVINGEMVRVGINLWDWLRQAREHGNCELFWIDAICIDQGSVTEKNNQLPVMTDIYSKAARCSVWLGTAADNSDLAIGRINKGFETTYQKEFSQVWTRREGEAIDKLFERRYWKRIWIVQEFVLPQDIVLHCGRRQCTWRTLSQLHDTLWHGPVGNRIEHHRFAQEVKSSSGAQIIDQRARAKKTTPFSSLPDLISSYQHMDATDVRDKVFGILGLTIPSELSTLGIRADYSKTTEEVYRQVINACSWHYSMAKFDLDNGIKITGAGFDSIKFADILADSLKIPPSPIFDDGKVIHFVGGRDSNQRRPPRRIAKEVSPVQVAEGITF